MLLAVQVVYGLYTTSAVTAATYDAARLVAGSDSVPRARAEEHVREVLGRYGRDHVRLRWEEDPDDVVLTVVADNPSFLPEGVRRPMGLDQITRTVRVRIEREIGP